MLLMLFAVVRVMLNFLTAIDKAEDNYGKDSYLKYWPTIGYSLVPIITSIAYDKLAVFLNDYEAYPTRVLQSF